MKKSENISVTRYVFYGLNIIFGLTFIVSLGPLYRGAGEWMFLLFALGAGLVFAVGMFYAMLAKSVPNAKGGVYTFVKAAFGYRAAFFFNWCQYIVSPTILVGETLSVVLAFSGLSWYQDWYWLVIILSAVFFIGFSILLIFGLHSTRIVILVFTILAFGSMAFYFCTTLARIPDGFFQNMVKTSNNGQVHVTFSGLISGFFTFFFALGGIEYLASSAGDLKDGRANVVKGISITMAVSLAGYLVLTLITKGVLSPNGLANSSSNLGGNPINTTFIIVFGSTGGVVLIYIFAVIKVISETNARLNIGWMAARVIEPMAEDGFLPASWAHRNQHQQLSKAILWHSIMSGVILSAILVPLVLNKGDSQTLAAPFQIYSVLAFVQFIGVLSAAIVLMHRGKVKAHIGYFASAPIIVLGLVIALILFMYSTITAGIAGDTSQFIALGSSVGAMLLSVPIYFLGKVCGLHKKGWKTHHVIDVEHGAEKEHTLTLGELPYDSTHY